MLPKVKIVREANLIQGHVLDVARTPLLAALRRYDPLLYLRWAPKKRAGLGSWELRRKPEFMSAKAGRVLETPKGNVYFPGDIFEMDGFTLCRPQYHETSLENHVKDFDRLDYRILDWVAKHDIWSMDWGFKGSRTAKEAAYLEAKFDEKIDESSDAERQYMIKQHRTQFRDFAAYINAGGNPARLVDYWGKE